MKHLKDLREYIEALQKLGDVREINREVDPHLEIAAVARHGYDIKAPAQIFTNVRGAAPGMRAMGGPCALSSDPKRPAARMALSLGLDADASWLDIVDAMAQAKSRKPIPPRIVDTAPCKENILKGEAANLDLFPIPYLHEGDGGPYCNTWGTIVCRTPDGRWTSWSIARIQKLDGHHMTGLFFKNQHITKVWEEWCKIGKPMPFALIQGAEPALPIVSSMPLKDDQSECDYLGAYFGEPIDVVRCETIDLEVPASSEIVIEGHVSLEREAVEGPFGEYAGYVVTGTTKQPIYTVECITHRDNAIWPFVPEGRPVDEYHTAVGVAQSAEALGLMREAGLPVTTVWSPLETANHWLLITVQPDWRDKLPAGTSREDFIRQLSHIIWDHKFGVQSPIIFVLDDDIDPSNMEDVLWAIPTRMHPTKFHYVSNGPILPLVNCYTPEERHSATGDRTTFDCLLPAPGDGRLPHSSFKGAYPQEIQDRVLKLWDK